MKLFHEVNQVEDNDRKQREEIEHEKIDTQAIIESNNRMIELIDQLRLQCSSYKELSSKPYFDRTNRKFKYPRIGLKNQPFNYEVNTNMVTPEKEIKKMRCDRMDDNIIVLNDEEGHEAQFEFIDLIEYQGNEYVVLLPVDEAAEEVVILQLEEVDSDTESYISVDNDEVLATVFELFKNRHKDDFDFIE